MGRYENCALFRTSCVKFIVGAAMSAPWFLYQALNGFDEELDDGDDSQVLRTVVIEAQGVRDPCVADGEYKGPSCASGI
jgi:hypothetical protein